MGCGRVDRKTDERTEIGIWPGVQPDRRRAARTCNTGNRANKVGRKSRNHMMDGRRIITSTTITHGARLAVRRVRDQRSAAQLRNYFDAVSCALLSPRQAGRRVLPRSGQQCTELNCVY